jgi:hypothetical protein
MEESMNLVLGLTCLSLAIIGFALALLGARDPKRSNSLAEFWIPSVAVPLIVGIAFFGMWFLFRFSASISVRTVSLMEITVSIAICVAVGFVLSMLKVRKMLAAYASRELRADVITLPDKTIQPTDNRPRSTPTDKLAA